MQLVTDMNPNDWRAIFRGFVKLAKFFGEEAEEPEHAKDGDWKRVAKVSLKMPWYTGDPHDPKTRVTATDESEEARAHAEGKLNEKQRAEADRTHAEREDMPANAFLEGAERKYPVKEKIGGEWKYSRQLLLAAARRARMNGEEALAKRADNIREKEFGTAAQDSVAIDLKSARSYDGEGRLHIVRTPISKANVCEYYGHEIPEFQKLGLDPQKRYRLLRDPEELAKAAPTFNGVQLMIRHVPVNADDHQPDQAVGSLGTHAEFQAPYLFNSLAVWARDAIDGIEDETRKQLSASYRYDADMTRGTYKGEAYDGVMRNIRANHVALVPEGRAGSDVAVADAALSAEWNFRRFTPSPMSFRAFL